MYDVTNSPWHTASDRARIRAHAWHSHWKNTASRMCIRSSADLRHGSRRGCRLRASEPGRLIYMNNETRSTEQQTRRTDGSADTRYTQYDFETESNTYAGLWAVAAGVGVGFLAMYFLDPVRGGRRR